MAEWAGDPKHSDGPGRHGKGIFSPQFMLGTSDFCNATTIVLCSWAAWHLCCRTPAAQRRGLFSWQLLTLLTVDWINALLHFLGYLPSIVERITDYDLMHDALYILNFLQISVLILEAQIAVSFLLVCHGSTRFVGALRCAVPLAFVISAVFGAIFWWIAPYHARHLKEESPLAVYAIAYIGFPLISIVSFACGAVRLGACRGMPATKRSRKKAMTYAGVFFATAALWDVMLLTRWFSNIDSEFFWSVTECGFWLWSLNGAFNAGAYAYWIRRTKLVRRTVEIEGGAEDEEMLALDGFFDVYEGEIPVRVESVVETPPLLREMSQVS